MADRHFIIGAVHDVVNHPLSPAVYTKELCSLSYLKAIGALCGTFVFFLFGENLLPLIIAFGMLILDTVTAILAVTYVDGMAKVTSKRMWQIIPKFVAMGSAFIVANWIELFEPALSHSVDYAVASMIIWVEAKSIVENIQRLDPRFNLEDIIARKK